jgi:DNA-binding MarR family transcriptional regulator
MRLLTPSHDGPAYRRRRVLRIRRGHMPQDGGVNDAEEPLAYLLHRVAAALRPQLTLEMRALGLGLADYMCMRLLLANPSRTSAELARIANVSAQAMNQVMHGLQDKGAITRPETLSPGRTLPAQLTATGEHLLASAEAAVHRTDQQILSRLTASEQRELRRLLRAAGDVADPA